MYPFPVDTVFEICTCDECIGTNDNEHGLMLTDVVQVIFLEDIVAEVLPEMSFSQQGVVDQLVCGMAHRFVGSFGSTFTGYVHRLRGYRDPALGLDPGMFFVNYPSEEKEWQDAAMSDKLITDAVWWSHDGIPAFKDTLWVREWSLTWDFPTSKKL